MGMRDCHSEQSQGAGSCMYYLEMHGVSSGVGEICPVTNLAWTLDSFE